MRVVTYRQPSPATPRAAGRRQPAQTRRTLRGDGGQRPSVPSGAPPRRHIVSRANGESDPQDAGKGASAPAEPQVPTAGTGSAAAPEASGSAGGIVAGLAVGVGVAAFAATRLLSGAPTLADLQAGAVPLNVAMSNRKPTIIEFYANWCETCREMTADTLTLEQELGGDVNFVMLNIDNTKWAEEMSEYNVNGIPEFVFLDNAGTTKALAVGRVPLQVLQQDAAALARGQAELPYASIKREASPVQQPDGASRSSSPSPRDHA